MSALSGEEAVEHPESSDRPERLRESCMGYVCRAVCTGCKEEEVICILERHVDGDVEEGCSARHPCENCQSNRWHNVSKVLNHIEEPYVGTFGALTFSGGP